MVNNREGYDAASTSPPNQESAVASVEILGVKVHCVDFAQTLAQIAAWLAPTAAQTASTRPDYVHQICTVNPEFIMEAHRDPAFAAVLAAADLCVPDGIGVIWAAHRRGVHLQERVTGSDGIYRICEKAAERGWRVYLLGAAEGVAAKAAQQLVTLYPGLQVAGTYGGSPTAEAWPAIAQRLQAVQPDILFVAYGHPRQDLWIAQYRQALPVKVALGVGGALDFVAGITPRAPRWMQQWGIEWVYRLLRQPWRWRRMLALPLFVLRVLTQRQDSHLR
ncbi:MAG: WecB/TagA/CpsF family glycosyltransferase [Caldilineaceae bacterium]|nr:WecB/TagA/CpsF family glycosyltransferase [Caldilineaceae bacterium]